MGTCHTKKQKPNNDTKLHQSLQNQYLVHEESEQQNNKIILKNEIPSEQPQLQKKESPVQNQEQIGPSEQVEKEIKRQFSLVKETIVEDNLDDYYGPDEVQYAKSYGLSSVIGELDTKIEWVPGEQIGQGSFGVVVMGMNKLSGKMMAVKQVKLTLDNQNLNKERVQTFQIEIEFLSRLSHKNIVSYYGTETTQTNMNIFLEYIGGGSLQSILQKFGKFKESLVKVYMRQILEGLIYLHDHGVVHRDIKSANILLDKNGVCKLADFGSGKKLSDISRTDMIRSIQGTPNYMAPEVVLQKNSGRKSDIWSLGCTMIELTTGNPPWHNIQNPITVMIKVAHAEHSPQPPEQLSLEAKDFLQNCLQIDPMKRWTARKLLAHSFLEEPKQKIGPRFSPNRTQVNKIQKSPQSRNSSYVQDPSPKHSNQSQKKQEIKMKEKKFTFDVVPKQEEQVASKKKSKPPLKIDTLNKKTKDESQAQQNDLLDKIKVDILLSPDQLKDQYSANTQQQEFPTSDQQDKLTSSIDRKQVTQARNFIHFGDNVTEAISNIILKKPNNSYLADSQDIQNKDNSDLPSRSKQSIGLDLQNTPFFKLVDSRRIEQVKK